MWSIGQNRKYAISTVQQIAQRKKPKDNQGFRWTGFYCRWTVIGLGSNINSPFKVPIKGRLANHKLTGKKG